MSAYIVQIETIQAIVSYVGVKERGGLRIIGKVYELQEIGQTLLDQNYRSVNERYRENEKVPNFEIKNFFSEPVFYEKNQIGKGDLKLDDIKIIAASDPRFILSLISNLSYQSCETSDWNVCEAHLILKYIKEICIGELTRDLPWGFDLCGSNDLKSIYKSLHHRPTR